MIKACCLGLLLPLAQCVGGNIGDQVCPCGGADLIIDHIQSVALFGQAQHGFGEVVAPAGIDPAGAEDQMLTSTGLYGLFSGQLAGAVQIEWPYFIGFIPGVGAAAIEDVIRGVMHQATAQSLHGFRHDNRGEYC